MQKSLLAILLLGSIFSCQAQPGKTKSSEIRLTNENEPGKPFSLEITVLDIDTRKPVKDAEIFAYHTNYKGDYENDAKGVARIHGTAWSNEKGWIRLITIFPRGYNNSNTGEHIHFKVKAPGYASDNAELLFADYYEKKYNINNAVPGRVYLESLEEDSGRKTGKAMLFMKKS